MADEPIKFYSDEPTGDYALKREGIANIFAQIALKCEIPLVIGFYGGWGLDKTPLMKPLEQRVGVASSGNPPRTLWFNPWQ